MTAQDAFAMLKFGFESGRPAQAYLVVGPVRGAGRDLVDAVLTMLFCGSGGEACGTCRGCLDAKAHTHADLLWVEPQKKSRVISVEQVRELQQRVFQTSFAGGWKVCVLAGADRLGKEGANAFLKTLEEPPERTVFFLLTASPHSLLPTILSRCQRVSVSGADGGLVAEWREELLAILGEGRAQGIAGAFSRCDRMEAIFKSMSKAAQKEIMQAADAESTEEEDDTLDARISARYREMRTSAMKVVLSWYRDILLQVCGADAKLAHNQDYGELIAKRAGGMTISRAMRNVAVVESMNSQMERNISDRVVLGYGFSHLS